MPSKKKVFKHWFVWLADEMDYVMWDARRPRYDCFRCGWGHAERCHITPRHEGGSDDPDNLHLLCGICHVESEYMDVSAYWVWLQDPDRPTWQTRMYDRLGIPIARRGDNTFVLSEIIKRRPQIYNRIAPLYGLPPIALT